MSTKDDSQNKGAKPNLLGNDEILEFAEEVLGSSKNDELINLEDAEELKTEGGEEIIDLTEVANASPSEDADVLDLTEIVDETQDADDDIIDLDKIAVPSTDEQEEEIMELEDMIDDADEQDDDIVDLDDMAIDPADEDEQFLDIEDIDEADITDAESLPDVEEQADEDTFIDEEELSLEIDDLGASDDTSVDEQLALDTEKFEGTFELEDVADLGMMENTPTEDLVPPELAEVEDVPGEPLELSENEQKALEEDLSIAFDEEDPDGIFELTAETTGTMDDIDAIGMGAEGPQEDIDLIDIANELAPAETPLEDLADEVTDSEEQSEFDALAAEDDLLPADGPADEIQLDQPAETHADVDFSASVDSPENMPTEEALDLSGFEAGQLAEVMSTETPEPQISMESPDVEPFADEDFASNIQPDVGDVFETPAETADLMDLPEVEDMAEMSVSDSTPDDLQEMELVMPSEEALDEPFEQPEPEPEQPSEIESLSDPVSTTSDEDLVAKALAESVPAADMTADEAESEPLEFADGAPDESLELDLDNEGDSEKSIEVIHETTTEKEFPPVEELEDLSIEGISASEDITTLDETSGMETPELTGTEQLDDGQSPDELAVSFEKTDDDKGLEIHSTADPISIKVKEHGVDDHANADDLLKVFDKQPESASLEALEPAIERVIQKVLSEKIESLLANAIESAVTREIERLKGILLADLKPDDES